MTLDYEDEVLEQLKDGVLRLTKQRVNMWTAMMSYADTDTPDTPEMTYREFLSLMQLVPLALPNWDLLTAHGVLAAYHKDQGTGFGTDWVSVHRLVTAGNCPEAEYLKQMTVDDAHAYIENAVQDSVAGKEPGSLETALFEQLKRSVALPNDFLEDCHYHTNLRVTGLYPDGFMASALAKPPVTQTVFMQLLHLWVLVYANKDNLKSVGISDFI